MKRCRDKNIRPKCVRINRPTTNVNSKKIHKHAEEKLLRNEIMEIRKKLSFVDQQLEKLTAILDNTLNKVPVEKLSTMIKHQSQKNFQSKTNKH